MKTRLVPLRSLALLALLARPIAAQELATPADWRYSLDQSAALVTGQEVPDSAWRFVGMPPGWHITMGPGGVLYQARAEASGRFALESQVFLFPGTSREGYGLFAGGRDLQQSAGEYLAFLITRDGRASIQHYQGGEVHPVADWRADSAITRQEGAAVVRNTLLVRAEPDSVHLLVNGQSVISVPRAGLAVDGAFGFRVGRGLNLHITTLDHTRRLAP